ncbi:hypothetical protein N7451_007777 [Penicillium sp. IBT 35674x]|nr:hypothetical protein N7451_007777 [Penicillium sp. IBT 35674x]
MPVLNKWPQWPEFTVSDVPLQSEDRMKGYNRAIVAEHGKQSLRKAWIKTCERLEQNTQQLITEGSSIIPVLEYEDLENFDNNEKQRMKELGCFVIREVIPQGEVFSQYRSLQGLIASNKESISAWPEANPAVYRIFWTPTRQAFRGHAGALRIRPPGKEFYGLGPHIDAGSLYRWTDSFYRKIYKNIFWLARKSRFL